MKKKVNIPRLAHAFFKWYCRPEKYEELHGDLEEFFYERVEEKGLFRAKLFYTWNVIRCFQPYAWRIPESGNANVAMFMNFYFTTVRNFSRHKRYFLINVSGLAIGIASFAFIGMYVLNELSYDQFHTNYKQIYRVNNDAVIQGERNNQATTSAPIVKAIRESYPEVINGTRILRKGQLLIGKGNTKINEERVLFADSELFNVFDFKLIKGHSSTALLNPRSMVLTQSYAKKYFGEENPIGRELTVEEDTIIYKVTGIVEDVPPNSHIQFDMLASLSSTDYESTTQWISKSLYAYIVLREDADPESLQTKMKELFYKFMAPEIEYYTGLTIKEWEGAGSSVGFKLTPVADIHLYSDVTNELEPTGNVAYVYIYGLIALIILFIAIFNFVNLATAHSATRAKEVGVRKVIGSTKRTLVYQFIFESILVSTLSTFLAITLIFTCMPWFTELVGNGLAYNLTMGYEGWLFMTGLALVVGLIAGSYPSFVLSAFKPVDVLNGTLKAGGKSSWLRNILVTIQFAASIIIIISTVVVYNQIEYMLTRNLGFEKDQVLVLERPDWLKDNMEVFKADLLENPNIDIVANSQTLPGKFYKIRSYRKSGHNEVFLFSNNQVTYDHLELMGLELIAGRFFSKDHPSDSNAVVLNETAARSFGFDEPIGQSLTSAFKYGDIKIIGIVKDYYTESLHKQIAPVSLELDPKDASGYLNVKLTNAHNIRETIEFIEDKWLVHSNGKPMQYFFFDQEYENLYKSETATGKTLLVFSMLSVFIASMGLIGLITYTSTVRRKEIGIRKVLGATTSTLVKLLSKEIVMLIIIATAIAWPLAYFATDYWLQNFSDTTPINPWIYFGATMAVLIVVGIAISYQTIKASTMDPVDSLRQE